MLSTPPKQTGGYKHLQSTPSPAGEKSYLAAKTFVRTSAEAKIKQQLEDPNEDPFIEKYDSPTQRPQTFAQAVMATRGYDAPSAGSESLGQLGGFTLQAKKKSKKWKPLDYNNTDTDNITANATGGGDIEETGSQSSRRSSFNPAAADSQTGSETRQANPDPFPTRAYEYNSNYRPEWQSRAKPSRFGEQQGFNAGNSAQRTISGSSGYSQEQLFSSGFAGHDKENTTVSHQGSNAYRNTYLNPPPPFNLFGNWEETGRSQDYCQNPQGFENYDSESWNQSTGFDADPNSTSRFTQPALHRSVSAGFDHIPDVYPRTPYPSVPYSTKPSKTETDQAMAHLGQTNPPSHLRKPGEDAFDSLEWDSDLLPTPAPDNSPESITIKPQPVAYTTVGSLVNPNIVPQFSAPNRIQREGANRRPLLPLLGNSRQYDSMLQPRGPPPPLSMANSMHYAQQIARSPVHLTTPPPPTTSSRSPRVPTSADKLTTDEEVILLRLLSREPQERSGNVMVDSSSPSATKKHSFITAAPSRQLSSVQEQVEEEAHVRSNSAPGIIQGLEKMQTLQRLAKFVNPMQERAKSRLSEFSVNKSQTTGKTVGNPSGLTAREMLLRSQIGMSKTPSAPDNGEGELDRSYKFPPPGFPATTQANPLTTGYSTSLSQTTSASARPGYPEPLTAGPPGGQRPYNQPSSLPSTNYQELWSTGYASQPYNPFGNAAASSPWGNQYTYQPPTQPELVPVHLGNTKTQIVDTMDPNSASKYYAAGWPTDMNGNYNYQSISEENARHMEEGPFHLLPKEVKDARRAAETTELWSTGQQRYGLNADDFTKELEDKKKNPFGPIGPPKKKTLPPVELKPVTVEEIKKKPIPELVLPALDNGFGTLLGYRASDLPRTNCDLSRLVQSSERYIDADAEGCKTLFGEDWGPPVKGSANTSWDH